MPVGRAKPNRRGGGDLSSLLDWTLKTDASGGFALGDTAVLYNGGMLESLRAPVPLGGTLSHSHRQFDARYQSASYPLERRRRLGGDLCLDAPLRPR
jgi:hypothetical protein